MKKWIKKIVVALTVLFTGLSLFNPLVANAQEDKLNLIFWHAMGGENEKALNAIVDEFNASQDKITVETQYQGSYDETLTKLRAQAAGGSVEADIVQIFELGSAFMIDSGLVVPVQDYAEAAEFDLETLEPNLLAYYTIQDKLWSMPFNSSTPLLYYNKDIFEAAGIEEVPTNLDEVYAVADDLLAVENVDYAISLVVYGWFMEQWFSKQEAHIFDNENGRNNYAEQTVFVDNGAMENIINKWKEGVDAGYLPEVGALEGTEFLEGKAAMHIASTAGLTSTLEQIGGRFELGTAYFPGLTADDQGGVSIGGASVWMMESGDEERKQATWEFIEFLVSPAIQAQWNASTGYFPVNLNSHEEAVFKENIELYPQFSTAIDQLHDSTPASQGAIAGVNQEARQIYESELERALIGEITPTEAVQNMADQVNAALKVYNEANHAE